MQVGMLPVSMFSSRSNASRFCSSQIDSGMLPCNWLSDRYSPRNGLGFLKDAFDHTSLFELKNKISVRRKEGRE